MRNPDRFSDRTDDPIDDPVSPGEILREEFLAPLGLTAYRLARELHVQQTRISEILAGRRSISADTALRLARYFGTTPELWLNLQAHYDLVVAERAAAADLASIRPRAAG
jgi:addiction module HigA family antidote